MAVQQNRVEHWSLQAGDRLPWIVIVQPMAKFMEKCAASSSERAGVARGQ